MRVTLPSGAWVDVKDQTVPGDRFAVRDAVDLVVEDGKTIIHGAVTAQWKAFLTRVIVAWSYSEQGIPVPAVGGDGVLDEFPDNDDDIDALEDALSARFERITAGRPGNRQRPPSPKNGTSSG